MAEVTLEKMDILRERSGATYREAKEALERHDGNVIEALVALEGAKHTNWTEEFSVRSTELMEKIKEIIRQGNVNKIRIKQEGRILAEIPVALGAIGAVVLPQLAAVGMMVAMFKRCTIEVVRNDGASQTMEPRESHTPSEEERLDKGRL